MLRRERPADRFSLVNFSGTILPGLEVPGVAVRRLGVSPRIGLYGAIYFPFLSPIRLLRGRTDAVFWSNLYYFGKDVPGVRQVVFVHDLRCLRYPDTSYSKELWMTKAAVRRLRKSRCPIVTPSGWTKKDIVELASIVPDRIHVVPHGIDRSFAVITDRSRLDAAAARLGLAGKRFVFYVGGFRKHKNLPMLLRAFRESRRRGLPDVLLVLAGDHPQYFEQILQEAEYDDADRAAVRYLGFVSDEDLVVLYNLAICLAFPSRNEGFGLPVAEAMVRLPAGLLQRDRTSRGLRRRRGAARSDRRQSMDRCPRDDCLRRAHARRTTSERHGAGRRADMAEDRREDSFLSFIEIGDKNAVYATSRRWQGGYRRNINAKSLGRGMAVLHRKGNS